MVKTTCEGVTMEWRSREEAISYFLDRLLHVAVGCDAEKRYTRVYARLIFGYDDCTDEEEKWD